VISLSIGLGEDTVDVGGTVVHSAHKENGMFHTGIAFQNLDGEARQALESYIAAFEQKRTESGGG
jgi:hypothetical protein